MAAPGGLGRQVGGGAEDAGRFSQRLEFRLQSARSAEVEVRKACRVAEQLQELGAKPDNKVRIDSACSVEAWFVDPLRNQKLIAETYGLNVVDLQYAWTEVVRPVDIEKALASTVQKTEDRLQAVAVAYVRFARQNPALMREMFADWVAEDEASSVYQAGKAVFRMYSGIIRSGQEKGEVTDDDTDELAGVFLSQIHGLAMLVIDGQTRHYAKEEAGIDQMVAFGIRTLYHGLHSRSQ